MKSSDLQNAGRFFFWGVFLSNLSNLNNLNTLIIIVSVMTQGP